jgi:PAS domain S-box-containing protein
VDPVLQPVLNWVLKSFSCLGESVVLADPHAPEMPLVYVSSRFSEMTGYPVDECIGRNCLFLQGPDTEPAAVARIHEALLAERPHTEELLNYRKDGRPFWNRLYLAPLLAPTGELLYFVGVQHDVTEMKRLEMAIAAETRASLISRPSRVHVNELSLSVVHEINTPLTVIDGRIQMALLSLEGDSPDFSSVQRSLGEASSGIHRLARMVASLRAFSRVEEKPGFESAEVRGLVGEALEQVRAASVARGVTCEVRVRTEALVLCDRSLFVQALAGLLMRTVEGAVAMLSSRMTVTLSESSFNSVTIAASPRESDKETDNVSDNEVEKEQTENSLGDGRKTKHDAIDPSDARASMARLVVQRHGGVLRLEPGSEGAGFALVLPRVLLEGNDISAMGEK